jgi:8-oxo-dGTP diphosphatase
MGVKQQGAALSAERYRVIPRTLTFIIYGSDLLLLRGAPDKRIWPGLFNGVGGHVESNETITEAALREIREEAGLDAVTDLRLRGTINIATENPGLGILLFVFTATSPTRTLKPSHEGHPEWVNWQTLDPRLLVPDLPILIPYVMRHPNDSPPFAGRYWYDANDELHIIFEP